MKPFARHFICSWKIRTGQENAHITPICNALAILRTASRLLDKLIKFLGNSFAFLKHTSHTQAHRLDHPAPLPQKWNGMFLSMRRYIACPLLLCCVVVSKCKLFHFIINQCITNATSKNRLFEINKCINSHTFLAPYIALYFGKRTKASPFPPPPLPAKSPSKSWSFLHFFFRWIIFFNLGVYGLV